MVSALDATSKLVLGAAGKLTDEFAQKLLNSEELQSGATVVVYLGSQVRRAVAALGCSLKAQGVPRASALPLLSRSRSPAARTPAARCR